MFTIAKSRTAQTAKAEIKQLQAEIDALQTPLNEAEAAHAAAHATAAGITQATHVRNLVQASAAITQAGHEASCRATEAQQAVVEIQRSIEKKRRKLTALQAVLALDDDLAAAQQAREQAAANCVAAQQAHGHHAARTAELQASAEAARVRLEELLSQVAAGAAEPLALAAAQAQVTALDALLPRLPVEAERLAEALTEARTAQTSAERRLRSVQADIALVALKEALVPAQEQAQEYLRLSGAAAVVLLADGRVKTARDRAIDYQLVY